MPEGTEAFDSRRPGVKPHLSRWRRWRTSFESGKQCWRGTFWSYGKEAHHHHLHHRERCRRCDHNQNGLTCIPAHVSRRSAAMRVMKRRKSKYCRVLHRMAAQVRSAYASLTNESGIEFVQARCVRKWWARCVQWCSLKWTPPPLLSATLLGEDSGITARAELRAEPDRPIRT